MRSNQATRLLSITIFRRPESSIPRSSKLPDQAIGKQEKTARHFISQRHSAFVISVTAVSFRRLLPATRYQS